MSLLYKDELVEITDQEVVFRRYYFPLGGDKRVPMRQIDSIQILQPSLWSGSWRLWGCGLRTWFPLDDARPSRDAIFVASLRGCFMRIGFTVQRSRQVAEIFRSRGLLQAGPSSQQPSTGLPDWGQPAGQPASRPIDNVPSSAA